MASGSLADGVLDPSVPEFEAPPPAPMVLLEQWFAHAREHGVTEPDALALATVDAAGTPSTRIVRILHTTDRGLVFTSHAVSPKGRDIAATGRVSGVLYWRETQRQVIVGGTVAVLPAAESEALWSARSPSTHPMSVATWQSAPMPDERELLDRARGLAAPGGPLPRPESWVGYEIVPGTVEFWHVGVERLHRRLRYDHGGTGWRTVRLQP